MRTKINNYFGSILKADISFRWNDLDRETAFIIADQTGFRIVKFVFSNFFDGNTGTFPKEGEIIPPDRKFYAVKAYYYIDGYIEVAKDYGQFLWVLPCDTPDSTHTYNYKRAINLINQFITSYTSDWIRND